MIIGSIAIKHWFPEHDRKVKDIDIVKNMQLNPTTILQNDFLSEKYPSARIEWLENPVIVKWFKNSLVIYLPPNYIYTLKISHQFWELENGSWDKHMYDIVFLSDRGCKIIMPFLLELYEYWITVHGPDKRSKLDMSAEKFFDNAITYPIPHDDLHEILIRHPYFEGQDKPTYTKVLKDGAEVEVDEVKFVQLTYEQRFNLVMEEVMVMAHERYNKFYYKKAFHIMLKKFIISHAPIWEAIWILDNYKEFVIFGPKFNFIDFLNKQINNGY